MEKEYKKGVFIEECKNRFICKVNIDGIEEECYVSSSCKLSNFINLKGKEVLLKLNKGKNLRTKYTLHALLEDEITLLNLNFVNDIVNDCLFFDKSKWKREYKFSKKLKTDYFSEKEKKIIEVKAIISDNDSVIFPSVYSERTIRQLDEYNKLLKNGYSVEYDIILMSKRIRRIIINKEEKDLKRVLSRCIKNGLKIKVYDLIWNDNYCIKVYENTKVILE